MFIIKIKKYIFTILCTLFIIGGLVFLAYQYTPSKPESIVTKNLNSFKNLDIETIQEFVTYEDFFGISAINQTIPEETIEVFKLFLNNFDFEIMDSITSSTESIVKVQLTTLDAHAVIKDYYKAVILYTMSHPSTQLKQNTESESLYLYFSILRDVLLEHKYDTVTSTVNIRLNKVNGKWKIILTDELEDSLFGGFVTYANAPNLFTPQEVLDMTLGEIKKLTPEQFCEYMGFNDIFSTKNDISASIDKATVEQILLYFDYEIINCTIIGDSATVTAKITSLDLQYILAKYADSLITYASTSQAINATDEEQSDAIAQLLLDVIVNNTESTTTTVDILLSNDGTCWTIELNGAFTDALIGDLSNATESFNAIMEEKTRELKK